MNRASLRPARSRAAPVLCGAKEFVRKVHARHAFAERPNPRHEGTRFDGLGQKHRFKAANSLVAEAAPIKCGTFLKPLVEFFRNILDGQRCHDESFGIQTETIMEAYVDYQKAVKDGVLASENG